MALNQVDFSKWEAARNDYPQLFHRVPCYISVQNPELQILQTNQLFQQDFGNRIGELCYEVYKRRSTPCPECPVVKTFTDGQVHSSEEIVITQDGKEAFVIVYTSPLYNNNEIVAVMEMSTNITDIKRLQTDLSLMGQTVATMAHSIKNILTGLDGGIYVVNSGLAQDNKDEVLKGWEIVQRNVARISNLVKDILYCAKKREHPLNLIAPNQVAYDVFELFHKTAIMHKIDLILDLDSNLKSMWFNSEDLHTILSNLVHNAIEACKFDVNRTNHRIIIRSSLKGPLAIFEVEDDGPGLPQEWENYIFTGMLSPKSRYGTGLGLLVTRKIVNELGGQLTFSSKGQGEGSIFRVSFALNYPPASFS